MRSYQIISSAFLTALAVTVSSPASAGFLEPFNTNTSDVPGTYSGFSYSGSAVGVVSGQQFRLEDTNLAPDYAGLVTNSSYSFATDSVVRIRAGAASGAPGSFNVALFLGTGTPNSPNGNDNYILFHPGYAGGALRVEGPGGFGNTDVGFTPAIGTANLHGLEVEYIGGNTFKVTLTDGSNPLLTYSAMWTNPALAASSYRVGVASNDGGGDALAVFDDIRVGNAQAETGIPEPASAGLLVAALSALVERRRRRRTAR